MGLLDVVKMMNTSPQRYQMDLAQQQASDVSDAWAKVRESASKDTGRAQDQHVRSLLSQMPTPVEQMTNDQYEAARSKAMESYQAPDQLTRWKAQIDAMMQSGNPTLQKEAITQMSEFRTRESAIDDARIAAANVVADGPSVTDANTYRDDYRADVKPDLARIDAFKTMQEAAKPDSEGKFNPAGDQSIVYLYAKMLDPTGIVTDSDFQNAKSNGNLDERVQGFLNQMVNGVLTPTARDNILRAAGNYYNGAIDSIQGKRDFYAQAAAEYKIPSTQIYNLKKTWEKYTVPKKIKQKPVSVNDATGAVIDAAQRATGSNEGDGLPELPPGFTWVED